MANVLSDEKKQQVLALGRLGWSLCRIERATGVRRETASVHLKAAQIPVRPPGAWGQPLPSKPAKEVITDSGQPNPAREVITDSDRLEPNTSESSTSTPDGLKPAEPVPSPVPNRCSRASACEPYRELIELGLHRGRNAKAIWQDLVSQSGFTSGYQSVGRFVRKLRGTQVPQARVVIVTAPGEEAQVDYGTGPMVRDPQTGKYRRTRLFVMTLGYSRKWFVSSSFAPALGSGPNCMRRLSAAWAGLCA
jgi:transposase